MKKKKEEEEEKEEKEVIISKRIIVEIKVKIFKVIGNFVFFKVKF